MPLAPLVEDQAHLATRVLKKPFQCLAQAPPTVLLSSSAATICIHSTEDPMNTASTNQYVDEGEL